MGFLRALIRPLVAGALLAAMPSFAQTAAGEGKVALVIGNAAYPSAQLRNPVNDARAMAVKLRALGFAVDIRTDASLREMTRAISQFGRTLKPGSVGLFYFAGHGVQVRGKNFLIPVDAEIDGEAAVRSEAVDVDQVLEQLGPARLSMVILDACRNNPFERRFRAMGGGGLAQIDAPTGSLLAYATAPGKVAADGTGANGLYTAELLKAMDVPGLKIEDVFKQVRINVLKASDGQQTPWESSSLTGEFFFRPEVARAVDDGRLRQAEREQAELRRTLEEERRKREQDAEALKQQLAELQAELARLRQGAVAPPSPPASPGAVAAPEGPTLEQQLERIDRERDEDAKAVVAALASRPVESERPAAAPVAAPAPASAPARREWRERIALLEHSRAQLTYPKAVAVLFDVSSEADLRTVIATDQALRRMSWNSAYAIGRNANGFLAHGWTWRNAARQGVERGAITNCEARTSGRPCKAIMINGDFNAAEFIDVAKGWADDGPPVARARDAYLKAIDAMLKLNRF
jgi:uncharacterized caspase-like protein